MPSQSKKKSATSKKKTATKKKAAPKKKTKRTTTKKTASQRTATKVVAAPKSKAAATQRSEKLRVSQVRSGIGHASVFRRTLAALGLKHHQDVVVVPDNPSIRGMLRKVDHLVSVKPEE
jgi:large subunit ribosomal protein L30